jgi:phosphomannomutase
MQIVFGTDGWRGVIGHTFNFENALLISRILFKSLIKKTPLIIVGYDRRFLSEEVARVLASELTDLGAKIVLSATPCPSPSVSHVVLEKKADAGLMVTASHNPPLYNGIKFKGRFGGSYTEEMVAELDGLLKKETPSSTPVDPLSHIHACKEKVKEEDFYPIHFKRLIDFLGPTDLKGLKVAVDAMHGSGIGFLSKGLQDLGAEAIEVRHSHNPSFGGHGPEPLDGLTGKLKRVIVEKGADLGVALDGDSDRIAARDDQGSYVDAHRIFAILLRYLAKENKSKKRIVKTFSTSDLIDRACLELDLSLKVTPIGFKHVCKEMMSGDVLLGGEESGGIGIGEAIYERDAFLCGLLLAKIVSESKTSLSKIISSMFEELGLLEYRRRDVTLINRSSDEMKKILFKNKPEKILGVHVTGVEDLDGIKFRTEDKGWIMFRVSGTEPLVRIYAEAGSPEEVENLVQWGEEWINKIHE